MNSHKQSEIPTVDWLDLETDRNKFMDDLRYALSESGFLVLKNAPGLDDEFQQDAFHEVRQLFDAPMYIKKTAHISNTPYFRGYTLPTPADRGHGQVIENFQYGFEQEPVCAHDDDSQPIYKRLFVGPNTWPKTDSLPGFRPLIEELNLTYHRLTHELGELIVESLGEDPAEFRKYFDFADPDLAASLNHNFSLDVFADDGYTKEELKMTNETKKILDESIELTATCVRIPVLVSHSEAVNIEFEKPYSLEKVREALSNAEGCEVIDKRENGGYSTPLEATGKDETYISRIREDKTKQNSINLWIVSDNLLRGAALNSVEIAETIINSK